MRTFDGLLRKRKFPIFDGGLLSNSSAPKTSRNDEVCFC